MSKKPKILAAMLFMYVSLICVGFASWTISGGNTEPVSISTNGSIQVDDVKREYSFEEFGIYLSSTTSNIEYAERNGEYVVTKHSIEANLAFDISNLLVRNMDFETGNSIGLFFSIKFFKNGVKYDNTIYNKISDVTLLLSNYDYLQYPLEFKNNKYFIPLKSKEKLSLYSICLMDSSIPNKTDYKVPFKIRFNMANFNYNIDECTFKINVKVGEINE